MHNHLKDSQSLRACMAACLAAGLLLGGSGVTKAHPVVFSRHDLDGDGRVNVADYAMFAGCRSGAAVPSDPSTLCVLADADRDGDVDADDFGSWQRCFSGEGPTDPDCGGLLGRFDFDGNGYVDDDDFIVFTDCALGAGIPPEPGRACRTADADGDADVDNDDWGAFQQCYAPAIPADPFCPAAVPPVGLTIEASGIEDTDLVITLGALDPYRPSGKLPLRIHTLPTAGTLLQMDGTPIDSATVEVADAQGRVKFRPAPNGQGHPYASFGYTAYSSYSGLTSAPTTLTISIANVNDEPLASLFTAPATNEDTPLVFALEVWDPDLPDDTHTFRIDISPNRGGTFYQVDPDGEPRLDLLISNGQEVTNPDGKVCFVPPANFHDKPGFPHVAFRYSIADAAGARSAPLDVLLDIISVNDPPIAFAFTYSDVNIKPILGMNLRFGLSDVEYAAGEQSLSTCVDVLPQHGTLYQGRNGDQGVNPITQAGVCVPALDLYYARSDWAPFGCGPDPSPSIYPLEDSVTLHMNDGVDDGNAVTHTVRITYFNTPPIFTGLTTVTTTEETPVLFEPTATDVDGHRVWFRVVAPLPSKGTLYFHTDLDGDFPAQIGYRTTEWPTRFLYVPFENVNTADTDPDVIHLIAEDELPLENFGEPRVCDAQVQVVIAPQNDPPTLTSGGLAYAAVTSDDPPIVVYPAEIHDIHIADDALPGDLLKVQLRAEGVNADYLEMVNTAGLANVTIVNPKEIVLEGTISALNAAFVAGVRWWPTATEPQPVDQYLIIDVDDQGHAGSETPPVPLNATRTILIAIDQEGTLPIKP